MEKNEAKKTELVPAQSHGIVKPVVSTADALEAFRAFQDIKEKVLSDDDKKAIKDKPYIRKTGWRKIKTIFNLSEEILQSSRTEFCIDQNAHVRWTYRVRVKAENGVFADAEMSCDTTEEFAFLNKARTAMKPETMIQAMAQTRAFNRAISDLVGGGEVTAEEIVEDTEVVDTKAQRLPEDLVCSKCNKEVSEKVAQYSMEKFGELICYNCQHSVTP